MGFRVIFKTGSESQNLTYTGLTGEVTINTDTYALRVHDGYTPGGHEMARNDLTNVSLTDFYSRGIAAGLGGGGGGGGGSGIFDGGDPFSGFDSVPTPSVLDAGAI